MGRKEPELTPTQKAEEWLEGALQGNIWWQEHRFCYGEEGGGSIEINTGPIISALRDAVKCWVRDELEVIKKEEEELEIGEY